MVSIQNPRNVSLRRNDRGATTADYGPTPTAAVIVAAVPSAGTSFNTVYGNVASMI